VNLEICVDSVESAIAADSGGADRIEVCSALREGGITPSAGLISCVRDAVSLDMHILIRPRGGDFVYSELEFEVMKKDAQAARSAGANGVVLGILTAEGRVDVERTRVLIELARPLRVTFHRAFDVSIDFDRSLEDAIASGADRLLSSGGEPTAMLGIERIAKLHKAAEGRIQIMAGGGVRESNVRAIVGHTGVREIHTSLGRIESRSAQQNGGHVPLGAYDNEFHRYLVTEEDVRQMRTVLDGLPSESGLAIRNS
jgi:copper homeostasis protein